MTRAGRPTRTTPEAWVQAALDTIEESGVAGLAVEPVARRLGVSKGGFYHHFADRRALLRAALGLWEERFVVAQSARFEAIPDPRERLRSLLRLAIVELQPTVITKLMAADEDPDVAAALERATVRRLAMLERAFADLGLPAARARTRARLAYSAYLGMAQLARRPAAGLTDAGEAEAFLAELEALLQVD
ncbi:Transcriptional regulator TetR family [Patulibacter medicamentivorans]|uniref:Transcriptional regulator TetR family n=1 Tax=Patulibacter medicamentivorans TaxID=1097667 RepID=H0E266_9ACTN|nr:TetR/AcrR family transcriptional regulator [Patulibacter medicamentivorans]EHN12203.1 Transcriptional regulator TetR family [Patulibacter medicamentivorans]